MYIIGFRCYLFIVCHMEVILIKCHKTSNKKEEGLKGFDLQKEASHGGLVAMAIGNLIDHSSTNVYIVSEKLLKAQAD